MSKNHQKPVPVIPTELPKVGVALEVPNYVIPTTDLEYKETVNGTRSPDAAEECTKDRSKN